MSAGGGAGMSVGGSAGMGAAGTSGAGGAPPATTDWYNPDFKEFVGEDCQVAEPMDVNDPKLPAPVEPGATQREAIFGVKSAADLTAIASELERDRPVQIDADGTVHARDPLGFGIAFRVAQRKPITAPELKFNTPGRPDRINTRGASC